MDAETFIKSVSPTLKLWGFKKSNATWRRFQEESIAVFNVQISQWGGGRYYVNIGTYFYVLGSDKSPTESKCHVQVCLPAEDPATAVAAAIEWFDARALLRDAKALAEADSKKGLVFKELRSDIRT